MELVTLPRLPICATGHYELASGPVDFTAEHFAAAVEAFNNDPAILAPRVRVEVHLDADGIAVEASGGQGGPALGWCDNLETDGHTLYADVHVPEELAACMEWAFPARSIEGLFGWTTATGHTHAFVATGLCLLGTDWPGVTTLPDLRELESSFASEVLAAGSADTPVMVVAPDRAAVMATTAATPRAGQPMLDRVAQAGLSVFDLRTRWYAAEEAGELSDLPESYDFWTWYVSEVRVDDDGTLYAVVYDDASGDQWRFDVTNVSGTDVTFGAPQPGMLDWRGATAAAIASAPAWAAQPRAPLARWTTRTASRTASASAPTTQEDDQPMNDALRRALASRHGLDPETASEAEVEAAVMSAETPETPEGNPPPENPPEGEPSGEPQGAAVEPEAALASGRAVLVDADRLATLEANAEQGATAQATLVSQQRDALVRAAIEDGRITVASAGLERNGDGSLPDGWRRQLDEHPEATAASLARLEAGRYPGTARASGTTTTPGGGGAAKVVARVRAGRGNDREVTHR